MTFNQNEHFPYEFVNCVRNMFHTTHSNGKFVAHRNFVVHRRSEWEGLCTWAQVISSCLLYLGSVGYRRSEWLLLTDSRKWPLRASLAATDQ